MAGGPNAASVACLFCFERADRTGEGLEDDLYQCLNGHRFGVDWSRGKPEKPCWPPTEEERREWEQLKALLKAKEQKG